MPRWTSHPLIVAAVVTLLNSLKPVCVDDAAYLKFAERIASDFSSPYSGTMVWSRGTQPCMDVLCPPVLPYWLAVGRHVVGDDPTALKLWLFPSFALLTAALRSLLPDGRWLWPIALSPIVVPMGGFMLDLPAMAFGLTTIVLFRHERRWPFAALTLALAIQTKYTMLSIPCVVLWAGYTQKRTVQATLVVLAAACLCAAWELFIRHQHGQSHFFHHLGQQPASLNSKVMLAWALLRQSGLLLIGPTIVFADSLWPGRRIGGLLAVVTVTILVAVCFFPEPWNGRATRFGYPVLGIATLMIFSLNLWRVKNDDSNVLLAWLIIEAVAMIVLSPFPAGRRLIAIGLVASLIVARMSTTKSWTAWSASVLIGLSIFAIDCWDARAEKVAVQMLNESLQTRATYAGLWGMQYYADRSTRLTSIDLRDGRCEFEQGELYVFPMDQIVRHFERPAAPVRYSQLDRAKFEMVSRFDVNDSFGASTIPSLYSGSRPIEPRGAIRFGLVVLRCTQSHTLVLPP